MRPIQRIARKNFSASSVGATFNQGPFWSNGLSSLWSPLVGRHETIAENFEGYVRQAYKANGVVFACILARLLIFSEARFQYQRFENGRPGDLFGDETLGLLEHPWANATTGELLAHMVQDADLAGNFFATKVVHEGEQWIRRLRPDWMTIVTGSPTDDPFDYRARPCGYIYKPRGAGSIGSEPVFFTPDRIAHWSPIPDPEAQWRGMSPLTPVIREIQADTAATKHKLKFFEHGATTNYVIVYDKEVPQENVQAAAAHFAEQHGGVDNAYKTFHLGQGADVKTVGADLKQLDFKVTQGAGETRIAAAFRVHPVIVGLSEGMQGSSLNAGNFNMARRSFADGTIRPLWRSASAALQKFTAPPVGARLWYDSRDIPFLREDAKDEAEIQNKEADTIGRLTDAGYDPDTVVAAVTAGDLKKLMGKHSGLFSVQLQPAGAGDVAPKALTTKATAAQLPALLKAGWTLVTDPEE